MSNLKRLLSQSHGNALPMIIIFTALLIGFFLTGGLLSTRKHDPLEQGNTPASQEAIVAQKDNNLQIGALKFLFPSSTILSPTPTISLRPTQPNQPTIPILTSSPTLTPTPTLVYCPKYQNIPNFNPINTTNNSCYCNELTECEFKTPKHVCQDVLIAGIVHPGVCGDYTYCRFQWVDGCENGGCAFPPMYSPQQCIQFYQQGDCKAIQCIAKPVIYLYPKKPMYVDLSVITSGEIVVSDPLYPKEGWKQVFAKPNGDLLYNNIPYKELFYESEVKDIKTPTNGIVIKQSETKEKLDTILKQLGLIQKEREEFLYYWLPRLKKTHAPYILFSLINPQEKHRVDDIHVNPEPDTRIEIIAYFKPLQEETSLPELILPTSIPERHGFTIVEWGGTLDN